MATFKVTFVNGATQLFTREDFTVEAIAREVFGLDPEGVKSIGAKIEDTASAPAKVAPIKSTKKKGE